MYPKPPLLFLETMMGILSSLLEDESMFSPRRSVLSKLASAKLQNFKKPYIKNLLIASHVETCVRQYYTKYFKKTKQFKVMKLEFEIHSRENHFRLLLALHASPWFDICNARERWLIKRNYVFKTFVSITRSGSLVTPRHGGDRDVGAKHVAAEMMNQTRSSSGIIQRARRREGGGRKLAPVCISSSLIIPPHVPEQTLLTWA